MKVLLSFIMPLHEVKLLVEECTCSLELFILLRMFSNDNATLFLRNMKLSVTIIKITLKGKITEKHTSLQF